MLPPRGAARFPPPLRGRARACPERSRRGGGRVFRAAEVLTLPLAPSLRGRGTYCWATRARETMGSPLRRSPDLSGRRPGKALNYNDLRGARPFVGTRSRPSKPWSPVSSTPYVYHTFSADAREKLRIFWDFPQPVWPRQPLLASSFKSPVSGPPSPVIENNKCLQVPYHLPRIRSKCSGFPQRRLIQERE